MKACQGKIDNIPPGLAESGIFCGTIRETTQEDKWPVPPASLKLLVAIPDVKAEIEVPRTYGVYDLDQLTVVGEQ